MTCTECLLVVLGLQPRSLYSQSRLPFPEILSEELEFGPSGSQTQIIRLSNHSTQVFLLNGLSFQARSNLLNYPYLATRIHGTAVHGILTPAIRPNTFKKVCILVL